MWEVIEALEMYGIPVVSLTSDGAKPNRRFYKMCQLGPTVEYKTSNPFRADQAELFFFCDVPHLLKTARNCFSNSFSHSKTRKMQVKNFYTGMELFFQGTDAFCWQKGVNCELFIILENKTT